MGELILDAPENKEILELAMTASLKVRRFIENNGVVGWRNEQIGHGASKHRDSEELITDIIDKTEKLKALMESLESEYDRLQLYTDSDILLSGYEISIQEYVNTNSFKIVDRETKSALFLGEILTYKKEKDTEYLFDSFSTNKKCAYYINYCYGNRDISHNRISALWNEISFLDVVPMSAEAVDEVKNAYIMKTVESIGNQQQFVEPVYMVDWLNHITDNYKAGVFLLQAEQGMGKTIFTKMVNEVEEDFLFYKPEGFEDFFIRTYNINDIYRYRLSLFKSEFHKLLINGVQQINGKYTIVARGTDAYYQETINLLSGSPHTALVQCAVKALPIFGKEAAIIILDAIDEIVPDEGGSLFDYIPDPGDVTDGVYIVLTSRTNKELTEAQAKRINALLLTEKKEITRDNKEYNETLYRYLKDRTGIKDMQEVQKIVDQQAHQQFLYVTHFARMYNIIKDKNVDIPGEKLPDYYLDYIKSISGSYYREFLKFVAILTMTNDAVTLDELVYLYGDDRITFKHMALLNDMAGFLTKTRSYRRTMYQLSHSLLRQQLINREDIQKVISELVEEYGHKVMEFIKSINNSEIDLRNKYQHYQGELWLLANYIDLKERYVQRNRTGRKCGRD